MPKINELPAATALTATDVLAMDNTSGTATKKVTGQLIKEFATADVNADVADLKNALDQVAEGQEHISVVPYNSGLYVNKNTGDIASGANYRVPVGVNSGVKIKVPDGCVKIFFDNWNITSNISAVAGWATYSTYTGSSISAFVRGGNTPYIDVQPGDNYFCTTLYSPSSSPATEFKITYVYANAELVTTVRELNDGGLDLKDDIIAEQVTTWLDEHPEAITTVQDASITLTKLAPTTVDYFTKRAFYNVRDYGIEPDTGDDVYNALFVLVKTIEAAGNGGMVYFPHGEYIISDTIFIPTDTVFVGDGPATHIVFNETHTSFGVALSNGGDNCGVMNMAVDCANNGLIVNGAMTGAIGFSTFDGTSMAEPSHSTSSMTRRNTKNVFAHNIWTNTRYVLQTETDDTYTIDGVTYTDIHAEKSCVSVQGRAKISNIKIDNVVCALFRTGFLGTADATDVQASNIKCGRAILVGSIVEINNIIIDPSYIYDELGVTYALYTKGSISIVNADLNGSESDYLIYRDPSKLKLSNVYGYGAARWITNAVGASDPTWEDFYLSNCKMEQTGTTNNVLPGRAEGCDLANVSWANSLTTIRAGQVVTYTPTLGSNTNISSSSGRASKIEVYDRKLVRIYLAIVRNADPLCTLPEAFMIKTNETLVGYTFNSDDPTKLVPGLCTIQSDGRITMLPLSGGMSNYNRVLLDATYMLDT